jgi:hypothetical protein
LAVGGLNDRIPSRVNDVDVTWVYAKVHLYLGSYPA